VWHPRRRGGVLTDSPAGIALDRADNVYVTGVTYSINFPTTADAFQTKYPWEQFFLNHGMEAPPTAFVSKLDADLSQLVYSTYLGGSPRAAVYNSEVPGDLGQAIAVAANGSASVVGMTAAVAFPTVKASQAQHSPQPSSTSAATPLPYDAFDTQLDPSGSGLAYSTYLGGTGYDQARAV